MKELENPISACMRHGHKLSEWSPWYNHVILNVLEKSRYCKVCGMTENMTRVMEDEDKTHDDPRSA